MRTPKIFLPSLLMFVVFTFHLSAQDPVRASEPSVAPAMPFAEIQFESTAYDFGVVEEGTRVSQVYTFTNTSDEPLVLINAKGSCGCTVPEWPREPIMPGETASLTVEFNSKGKKGKRSQKVTITANTTPPQTFLSLTGEVLPSGNDLSINAPVVEEPTVSPDCFAIFPNPTAEILKLDMEDSNLGKSALITIYSKSGQLMARRVIEAVDGVIEFNVSHYPPGTYMANVQVGKGKPQTRCFVVVD